MVTLLSVIVPAYNAEAWVESCICSILRAPMPYPEALEVIAVNDGSKDRTQEILENLASQQPAIRVINQENIGLSGARNAGMQVAHGKYLAFVDADDEWCPSLPLPWKMLEEEEIEIIGLDMVRRTSDGKISPYRRYRSDYRHLYKPALDFLQGRNLFPSACANLYARTLIEREKLSFIEGIYHEDEEFTTHAFLVANSFKAVPGPHYLYIERANSITTNQDTQKTKKRMKDLLLILKKFQSFSDPEQQSVLRCKICFLATDMVRVLLANTTDKELIASVLSDLKSIGLYPFPFYPNLHYLAIKFLIQLRLGSSRVHVR